MKTNKGFFLIETKGVGFEEMASAKLKENAGKGWCEKISKLLKQKWQYVKIVEDDFRQYSAYPFTTLIKTVSS